MFRNFIRFTTRNLLKNRVYTIINIIGLSFGLLCSIFIFLWVSDEISFDKFHPKAKRLHQLYINAHFDGSINSWRSVPLPSYEALKSADAQIVNTVATDWGGEHLLQVEETRLLKDGYYVSEEFLTMFEFPVLEGDPSTALNNPSSIAITASLSKALFGEESAIGKVIRVDDEGSLQVSAILKDIPQNSSFQFEYLLPWKYRESVNEWVVRQKTNWGNNSFQVFVELTENADSKKVEANIKDLIAQNLDGDIRKDLFLHPLTKWRLNSTFENGKPSGGIIEFVRLFSLIAIFILIIACINFMNLATARSEGRAKEVGIKKSLGISRFGLISQFLGESLLITTFAFAFAILLVIILMPQFNLLVDKELFSTFLSGKLWIYAIPLIVIIGLISGSYPAFFLSAFKPIITLKGNLVQGKKEITPRRVLVTIQFGLSILLLIGTMVIYQQIQLVQNRELGYSQENLISVGLNEELVDNYELLKLDLLGSGVVEAVTKSNSRVTDVNSNNFVSWPGKDPEFNAIFATIVTDYDYTETMGIEMLMGRDFSKSYVNDTASIIVNKTALDLMKLEEPIIGTELDLWGNKRKLIGVVDDVLMGSLYEPVQPTFFILEDWGGYVSLRLKEGRPLQESLASVQTLFEKHNPTYPFDFQFMDAEFEKKFTSIKLTQKLAALFSLMALIITGLGMFGLASYMAEKRTKELGIRKVLGASVFNLVNLLLKEFSRLIILSFVLFAPLSWWLLDNYLNRYAVRVDIAWWIFPIAGILSMVFAFLIVGNQARKAALTNPINALRSE